MNFLQLTQKTRRKCSVSGSGPTSVQNQTGEMARLIDYVQDAVEAIETMWFNWKFLWASGSLTTEADKAVYQSGDTGFPTDASLWKMDHFQLDGVPIEAINYEDFDPSSVSSDSSQPVQVIIRPDNSLQLEPKPDGTYTLSFEYYRASSTLSENTDAPLIPARFHRVIIGRAMMMYGNYESAPEVKAEGSEMYEEAMEQLENSQLPRRDQIDGVSDGAEITVVPE